MSAQDRNSFSAPKFASGRSAALTTIVATVALVLASIWLLLASLSHARQKEELENQRRELSEVTLEYRRAAAEAEQARINLAQQASDSEKQIRQTAGQLEVELRVGESLIKGRKAFVSQSYEIAAKNFEEALNASKPRTPLLFNQAAWSYYLASTQPETDGKALREKAKSLFELGITEFPEDAHLLANYAAVVSELGPGERQNALSLADRLAALDTELAMQLSRAPQTRWIRQEHQSAVNAWRNCLLRREEPCSLARMVQENDL